MLQKRMTILPLLILGLSPFVIFDSNYVLFLVGSVSQIPFGIFL